MVGGCTFSEGFKFACADGITPSSLGASYRAPRVAADFGLIDNGNSPVLVRDTVHYGTMAAFSSFHTECRLLRIS
jgi:hypothetical protein